MFEEEKGKNIELYVKALSRKALCLNKLKKHDESLDILEKCLNIKKDDDIEKLKSTVKIEKEIYDKAMSLINKTHPEFEYNLYNIVKLMVLCLNCKVNLRK